jgi:ABC-type lipoprotein release transport system permease subunit
MLKRHAVDLLRGPEAPRNKPRFYEKWKAWDRLPLYSQSMVNNFFNDRLRVFGTLVGIAGCTALVVTAMTMYVNVQETFNVQYEDVYAYTGRVAMDATPQAETQIMRTVLGAGAQGTAVLRTTMALNAPDDTLSALTVEVPNDAYTFEKLYHLNDTNGGGQAQLDTYGVWLSAAYASHYGVKVGDSVRIVDASGTSHDLVIAGFFEYHLGHAEAVMSPDYYQQIFGSTAVANTVLVSFGGADAHATVDQLKQTEGFFSYTDDYALSSQQFESFQSLTRTVVIIYLGLSALMAVVVLLNLTVMFIEEKRRDLIVLMINGFSLRDAKRYIYRDNIALTVIGIVLGLLVGMAMGYFSLLSIEFAADSYVLVPSWVACATGAAASALFELCVNLVALRRIPQFNLTDINKI